MQSVKETENTLKIKAIKENTKVIKEMIENILKIR